MDAGTMYANAKALHELLQEARAENSLLTMRLNAEHLVRQNVERENAKLRELVRTLHHCAARGECDVCAMRDGRGLDEDTVCLAMHDRMRELGVEV